jgi:hypothetical protein
MILAAKINDLGENDLSPATKIISSMAKIVSSMAKIVFSARSTILIR